MGVLSVNGTQLELDDRPFDYQGLSFVNTGIRDLSGRPDSQVEQHLQQIDRGRACGGYHNDHHDMFQNGYGHPATPPLGIPEPTYSDFHRPVFQHLRQLAPPEVLEA